MAHLADKYGPEVQKVPADTPIEDILYLLKRDGGIFIKSLVSDADLDQTFSECRDRLDSDVEWNGSFFLVSVFFYMCTGLKVEVLTHVQGETQRAPAMLALSPSFAKSQVMNPLYQAVVDHFLTTRSWFWWGDERKESVSKPYVHSCTAMRIGPGGKAQPLHRDDYISHNIHQQIDQWDDERDANRETAVGLFVAGCKVTKENGGTQFIPRSHLWGSKQGPPKVEDCIFADMDRGDAFIMLASAYHGGGTNVTKDEHRLVYATFSIRGFLRQEENQFLAVPREIAVKYDHPTQAFMGYSLSDPACGYVDQVDPIFLLRPELKEGPSDF